MNGGLQERLDLEKLNQEREEELRKMQRLIEQKDELDKTERMVKSREQDALRRKEEVGFVYLLPSLF